VVHALARRQLEGIVHLTPPAEEERVAHRVVFDGSPIVIVEKVQRAFPATDGAPAMGLDGHEPTLSDYPTRLGMSRNATAFPRKHHAVTTSSQIDLLRHGSRHGERKKVPHYADIDAKLVHATLEILGLGLGPGEPGSQQQRQGSGQECSAR